LEIVMDDEHQGSVVTVWTDERDGGLAGTMEDGAVDGSDGAID
jgi:hypothetical protein